MPRTAALKGIAKRLLDKVLRFPRKLTRKAGRPELPSGATPSHTPPGSRPPSTGGPPSTTPPGSRPPSTGGPPPPAAPAPPNPMNAVPPHATQTNFWPHPDPNRPQRGVNYRWTDANGAQHRFRVHEADGAAPPGSNAANGPIYRHQVGQRYMDANGNLHHPNEHNPNSPYYNPAGVNDTHIPWPPGVPLPYPT